MELPQIVIIGEGSFNKNSISHILKFKNKGLIITGPHVLKIYNREIDSSLSEFSYDTFIVNEPTYNEAERVLADIGSSNYLFVIGIGGGKTLDIAKYVGFKLNMPVLSVPTNASNDGIASPFSSLRGGKYPYSLKVKPPLGVIADISIIMKAPKGQINSGLGDLIGKITSVRDWYLGWKKNGEYYGEYASKLALESARHALASAEGIGNLQLDSVKNLLEALISAGVAGGIAGSSRPLSGSEHLITHALDVLAPGLGMHGEKVGINTVFTSYLYKLNWNKIKLSLSKAGLPVSYKELGINRNTIVKAIIMAPTLRPERYTILHQMQLSESKINEILDYLEI
ncbi:MAG: sn-glycerol-1-phosphate dehydrogenase [Conexivisphaerales archaeon]